MKKTISASAPGKFHLVGEHSSVYGKPAMLCALNKRVKVTVEEKDSDNFFIEDNKAMESVVAIRSYIDKKYKIKTPKFELVVSSQLPIGRGLGSSAAFCAAVSYALFGLNGLIGSLDEIYEAAYLGEKVFHGNPSGGDLAVSVYGGVIWFRKETENIKLVRKLKVASSLFSNMLLIDSGKPVEGTYEMVVDVVGRRYKKEQVLVEKFLSSQEKIAKEMSSAMLNHDKNLFEKTISQAGYNLEKLGIVGKQAKRMIKDIERSGGYVKVSGGGGIKEGSGMLIAISDSKNDMIELCKENNWEYLKFNLEQAGVKSENE